MEKDAAPLTLQITNPKLRRSSISVFKAVPFMNAEDVILQALPSSRPEADVFGGQRREAIERRKTFGKKHALSLGGMMTQELRHEARPWGGG
jgi:hypothetical protein